MHFIKINEQIKKLWGNTESKNLPKFIVLAFEGNQEEYWKPQLERNGIKVINIAELIGKENLENPELGFFEPELSGHPNGKLWKEVIPKLKEMYPDL